jgi:hypothetical protein
MKIRGIDNMTLGELVDEVKLGGRFVVYHWSVGLLIKSIHVPSAVHFVPPGHRPPRPRTWFSLATLLTGWWAIPFGPARTIACVRENLAGGRDVTASVLRMLAHFELHPRRTDRSVTSNAA